jgi:hypothetical protein
MEWCDRLSLILCQQQLPEDQRALEISSRLDNQRYDVRQLSDDKVTVEPWCFEKDEFTVNIEAIHLNQLKFKDNAALQAAFREAPIEVVQWHFAKSA